MRTLLRFFIVVMIAVPCVVWADGYKESYGKAISKIENGKWDEAEQLIRAAIADNPSASTKKMRLYGNRTKPYLPYFHLGLTLFEQGDCQGAMQAWATAEQQGAIQSFSKEYKQFNQKRAECRQRMPTPTATRPPLPTKTPTPRPTPTPKIDFEKIRRLENKAKVEIANAEKAAAEVRQRHGDSSYEAVWLSMSDAPSRESEAANKLKQAQSSLRNGSSKKDESQLDQAFQLAEQARKSYELVVGAADSKHSELAASELEKQVMEAARNKLFAQIEERSTAAQGALNRASSLLPESRRSISAQEGELKAAVREAGRIRSSSLSVTQLEEILSTLDQGAKSFGRLVAQAIEADKRRPTPTAIPAIAATKVPVSPATPLPEVDLSEKLRSAAGAFLRSDYESVVGELEVIGDSKDREAAVAYLLRGAAGYYIYLENGKQDAEIEQQARNDVDSCRAADASLTPDAEIFSPAFVTFFSGL